MGAPPAEVTDEVLQEMRAKHPEARLGEQERLQSLRAIAPAAAYQADVEAMEKAMRAFPRGSAPGLAGLRPQHLKRRHGTRAEG